MDFRAYRSLLDQIAAVMRGAVRVAVRVTASQGRSQQQRELVELLYPTMVQQRQAAHDLAETFMRAQRSQQGIVGEPISVPVRPYSKRELREAVRKARPGVLEDDLATVTTSHVRDAARRTVTDSIEAERVSVIVDFDDQTDSRHGDGVVVEVPDDLREPRVVIADDGEVSVEMPTGTITDDFEAELEGFGRARYARILSGTDNCALCIWTASRGAVYRSAYAAGDRSIHEYHPGCDCDVVPVWDVRNWDGNAQAQYLYAWANDAFYREVERRKAEGIPLPRSNEGINLLRSQLRHYSPDLSSI